MTSTTFAKYPQVQKEQETSTRHTFGTSSLEYLEQDSM